MLRGRVYELFDDERFTGISLIATPPAPPTEAPRGAWNRNWRELLRKALEKSKEKDNRKQKPEQRKVRVVRADGVAQMRRPEGFGESTVKRGASGASSGRSIAAQSSAQCIRSAAATCIIAPLFAAGGSAAFKDKRVSARDELMAMVGLEDFA